MKSYWIFCTVDVVWCLVCWCLCFCSLDAAESNWKIVCTKEKSWREREREKKKTNYIGLELFLHTSISVCLWVFGIEIRAKTVLKDSRAVWFVLPKLIFTTVGNFSHRRRVAHLRWWLLHKFVCGFNICVWLKTWSELSELRWSVMVIGSLVWPCGSWFGDFTVYDSEARWISWIWSVAETWK